METIPRREPNGYYTRLLGKRLEELLDSNFPGQYRVYYDHKLARPDKIMAHIGEECRENNLARLDIAVISMANTDHRLMIVSEIEEHKHTPKRFLGDLAAIMMSEKIKVDNRDYPLNDVTVVLGLISKRNGVTGQKARKFTSDFMTMIGESKSGKRGIDCVVVDADNGSVLIHQVENIIRSLLIKGSG